MALDRLEGFVHNIIERFQSLGKKKQQRYTLFSQSNSTQNLVRFT